MLRNVPDIADVRHHGRGAAWRSGRSVDRLGDGEVAVDVAGRRRAVPEAPYELVEQMRASVVVLGPLLARCGYVRGARCPAATTSATARSTST